jgi:hypothetical protein
LHLLPYSLRWEEFGIHFGLLLYSKLPAPMSVSGEQLNAAFFRNCFDFAQGLSVT